MDFQARYARFKCSTIQGFNCSDIRSKSRGDCSSYLCCFVYRRWWIHFETSLTYGIDQIETIYSVFSFCTSVATENEPDKKFDCSVSGRQYTLRCWTSWFSTDWFYLAAWYASRIGPEETPVDTYLLYFWLFLSCSFIDLLILTTILQACTGNLVWVLSS